MTPDRLRDLVIRADRGDLGGAVAHPHTGLCGRDLHDGLRMVGHRMVEGLMLWCDTARRAVVVGAVMQRGAASVGTLDRTGHRVGAVRAEHCLRAIDPQLEALRVLRQAMC